MLKCKGIFVSKLYTKMGVYVKKKLETKMGVLCNLHFFFS